MKGPAFVGRFFCCGASDKSRGRRDSGKLRSVSHPGFTEWCQGERGDNEKQAQKRSACASVLFS